MLFVWVILALFSSAFARGPELCDILDLPSCSGTSKQNRRTSNLSLPSPATAANLNPANTSVDRGFGGEALLQANNPVAFNLVGGSGKFGGAMISPTLENSFFGVRVPELAENFLKRNKEQKRYDPKKINLALAGTITRQKNYGLDFGLLFKRHSEVKKIRTGFGLAGRLWFLNIGASYYKDDFWLDFENTKQEGTNIPYSVITGKKSYDESFQVKTVSAGIKVKNFSFDVGKIITDKYSFTDENIDITLFSASMAWRNFLFNYGQRKEESPTPKFKDDALVPAKVKNASYAGIQYSWWRPVVVGVHYNYFLLNELSATVTIFIR